MYKKKKRNPIPPPVDPDAMPKCPTTGVQKVKEEVSDDHHDHKDKDKVTS